VSGLWLVQTAAQRLAIDAARLAGVHEMILRLPEGYATEVGAQGATLSGGQRQSIGLARAMFGAPRVVVLDEPSASLDQVGENAVLDAIGRLKARGCTVILVVHRPRLLTHVDKVLVLSEGAGVLFGPRDQVLARIMVRGAEGPAVAAASGCRIGRRPCGRCRSPGPVPAVPIRRRRRALPGARGSGVPPWSGAPARCAASFASPRWRGPW
jgi:ABC-type sugar transport system ATPase subunit